MTKLKKFLCFVIPMVLIIAITLGVTIPLCVKDKNGTKIEKTFADETGASTADISQKGGAIYVEKNYTHNSGTISGKSKMYGGAVFVAKGGVFTMSGGEISNNAAKYGGAIYVAAGGECIISGGTITNNKGEVAPAIYVENGGKLTISGNAVVKDNTTEEYVVPLKDRIGPEEMMGGTYIPTGSSEEVTSTIKLKTIYFGSYPQTYVGDELNDELESWWSEDKPVVQTYTIREQVWESYLYEDGLIYARGICLRYDIFTYKYKDGTNVRHKKVTWFKVEPIKWFIMNYDAWSAGEENMELFSVVALAAYIRINATTEDGNNWAGCELQGWLKDNFYNTAFTKSEQSNIAKTENKNNISDEYKNAPSTWTGTTTYDNVYCKTYYEMCNGMFAGENEKKVGNGNAARQCSPTDFALSNHCALSSKFTTEYRTGTCFWWLRSAGLSRGVCACYVAEEGYLVDYNNVYGDGDGIRPALHLSI